MRIISQKVTNVTFCLAIAFLAGQVAEHRKEMANMYDEIARLRQMSYSNKNDIMGLEDKIKGK